MKPRCTRPFEGGLALTGRLDGVSEIDCIIAMGIKALALQSSGRR